MTRPLLIQRGRLIDPRNGIDGVFDLLLENGKVSRVSAAPLAPAAGAQVIDASGKWVFPGFIDLHVHLREPGEERKETILTGSRAAVAGGFTAVVAMPNTKPVNDSVLVTRLVLEKARAANLCRVYPAGAISKGLQGEEMAEIGTLVQAGCVCITDDGRPVMNAALMRRVLQWAKPLGVPVMVHEEDLTLSARGSMTEGPMATRLGLLAIPASAEVAMVARDMVLVEETGCALHVAHLSCEGSVRLVREAKRRGLPVTCEVAPHHFTLTDEAVAGYDTHAKMMPPLRLASDVRAVQEGLADGTVDAIATDHAPHGPPEKQVEFEKAMNGIVGLETALPLTLELVRKGLFDVRRMAQLLSEGPARIFKLSGGHLGEGALGDVTVVDPDAEWTIASDRFLSKSRNTPFHGRKAKGRVSHTIVGGRVVFEGGAVKEEQL
jgi:dihydroorotase